MAYDEDLAGRIRELIGPDPTVTEQNDVRTRRQLATWVGRGTAYARSLPPKRAGTRRTPGKG